MIKIDLNYIKLHYCIYFHSMCTRWLLNLLYLINLLLNLMSIYVRVMRVVY